MAKVLNGFLGDASGKLGSVVFSRWKNIYTVRQWKQHISDPNTQQQQTIRIRMQSLIQFLRGLNGGFLQSMNKTGSTKQTPWSKALKDNFDAVDDYGNIDYSKLTFGPANLPAPKMLSIIYNPFIDLLAIEFSRTDSFVSHLNYPAYASGAIMFDKYPGKPYIFNTDNTLNFSPPGWFTCEFEDQGGSHYFSNGYANGSFWFIPECNSRWDMENQTIPHITNPTPFVSVSILPDLDFSVDTILMPPSAFTAKYNTEGGILSMKMEIDLGQLDPIVNADYLVRVDCWVTADGKSQTMPRVDTKLSSFPYSLVMDVVTVPTLAIFIVSLFDENGIQCSLTFKNVKIEKQGGDLISYFRQIFNSRYCWPTSFKYLDDHCGLALSISDLFPAFIQAFIDGSLGAGQYDENTNFFTVHLLDINSNVLATYASNERSEIFFELLSLQETYYVAFLMETKTTPELIDVWKKNPQKGRKVIPGWSGSIVSNANADTIPTPIIQYIKANRSQYYSWNVPTEGYVSEALDKFQLKNPKKYKKTVLLEPIFVLDF